MWKRNCPIIHMHRFLFFSNIFGSFAPLSKWAEKHVQCQDWVLVTEVLKVIAFGQYMAKNVLRVDRLFWKHMHFLTSGSLVFLMGFGSLCLSPDTTLRTALTSTGTPLDDWSWRLAFLVGKGGFRYAPKRLPVSHRLRLEGLARVRQNHLCRFSRVFQSSCLRLTLATRWLRGVVMVRQCWGTADTLCQSHVVEESFDSPRVCTCRSNCFLSFLSLHLPCPALFFKQHPVLIEKSPTSAE